MLMEIRFLENGKLSVNERKRQAGEKINRITKNLKIFHKDNKKIGIFHEKDIFIDF